MIKESTAPILKEKMSVPTLCPSTGNGDLLDRAGSHGMLLFAVSLIATLRAAPQTAGLPVGRQGAQALCGHDSSTAHGRNGSRGIASQWQWTLWVMVGIQFIMTMSFSFLSPIMPLFLPELGVKTEAGIDLGPASSTVRPRRRSLSRHRYGADGGPAMDASRCCCGRAAAIAFFTALMGLSLNVWQSSRTRADGVSPDSRRPLARPQWRWCHPVPSNGSATHWEWLSTGQLVGSLVGPVIPACWATSPAATACHFYCTLRPDLCHAAAGLRGVREDFSARRGSAAPAECFADLPC